jgi:putative tryptophan/tyrosine transport system substrate-binding protein
MRHYNRHDASIHLIERGSPAGLTRRDMLGGLAGGLWVATGPLPSGRGVASAAASFSTWFRLVDQMSSRWHIAADQQDAMRVDLRQVESPDGPKRKILVIYPRPSSAYDIAISRVLDLFTAKGINAAFTALNFRLDDGHGAQALEIAEAGGYDLIFSMGSESTAWLYQYYRNGELPVVSICSKDPVALGQMSGYDVGSGSNFAFTSLNMPIEVQLAYMIDFKPNLRNLGILVDSKNASAVRTQAKPMEAAAKARGIRPLYIAVDDPENAANELAVLLPAAVNRMRETDRGLQDSVFWITGSTAVFREMATINAHADRVPVLSAVPEVVQAGDNSAVLSVGISFESNAYLAAVYALRILNGEVRAGDLKVGIVSPPDIAINFRRAQQIGLDVPFSFFESANYVYDNNGNPVRLGGEPVAR